MMRASIATWVLSACGLGRLRPAPGTWGSLPPVGLAMLLAWTLDGAMAQSIINIAMLATAALATLLCLWLGAAVERACGRKDPGMVVMDEVAGQALALLLLPWRLDDQAGSWMWNLGLAGSAFAAFRVMDVIKPPPARGMQRMAAGLGIVVDDLVAGLYALAVLQVAFRVALA